MCKMAVKSVDHENAKALKDAGWHWSAAYYHNKEYNLFLDDQAVDDRPGGSGTIYFDTLVEKTQQKEIEEFAEAVDFLEGDAENLLSQFEPDSREYNTFSSCRAKLRNISDLVNATDTVFEETQEDEIMALIEFIDDAELRAENIMLQFEPGTQEYNFYAFFSEKLNKISKQLTLRKYF